VEVTYSGKQSSLITTQKCLKVDLTKKLDSDKKNRRQQLLLMDLFHRNLLFSFRPKNVFNVYSKTPTLAKTNGTPIAGNTY